MSKDQGKCWGILIGIVQDSDLKLSGKQQGVSWVKGTSRPHC